MKSKPIVKSEPAARVATPSQEPSLRAVSRRHLQLGWWSLLLFLTLGLVLEGLHGFKVAWYLNVSNETRRLMWTLAHAHGTLVGLIQIAFALTVGDLPARGARQLKLAGSCLLGANLLLPGGFLLGGFFLHGGDPGLGVLLVPLGGLLLFTGVLLTARSLKTAFAS